MQISPLAGLPAPNSILADIPKLIEAYYSETPDPSNPLERVVFGTSGHRGSSIERAFNETHILAITQAICEWRKKNGVEGPLFLGMDTHALSRPALMSAIEVLIANGVDVFVSENDEYTPTPAVSHAILCYNRKNNRLADGIVITPSHNPPDVGGFKYNATNGGPADVEITKWIEIRSNELLGKEIKRIPFEKAIKLAKRHNYLKAYVDDLDSVIDMEVIRGAKIHLGVDPLGGAGVHYWEPIAKRYGLDLTVVNQKVDPTFRFMSVDWDGKIRMDPSSSYAMQRLIDLKDRFQIAFACDTDHDRHGIVTKSSGLLPPNHYLAVCILYLFRHRKGWNPNAAVGKTIVSSQMIDKVAQKVGRKLVEVPVGFKWFVDGLYNGTLGFGGEESAGASFLRKDGTAWSTDKDGIIAALLSAEITAREGKDPGEQYLDLTKEFGVSFYTRIDAETTREQKEKLKNLTAIQSKELAGDKIEKILSKAPGNGASIGGIKVETKNGWFAARPSGTEDIYKIYGESFISEEHLQRILDEAQRIVNHAIQNT